MPRSYQLDLAEVGAGIHGGRGHNSLPQLELVLIPGRVDERVAPAQHGAAEAMSLAPARLDDAARVGQRQDEVGAAVGRVDVGDLPARPLQVLRPGGGPVPVQLQGRHGALERRQLVLQQRGVGPAQGLEVSVHARLHGRRRRVGDLALRRGEARDARPGAVAGREGAATAAAARGREKGLGRVRAGGGGGLGEVVRRGHGGVLAAVERKLELRAPARKVARQAVVAEGAVGAVVAVGDDGEGGGGDGRASNGVLCRGHGKVCRHVWCCWCWCKWWSDWCKSTGLRCM